MMQRNLESVDVSINMQSRHNLCLRGGDLVHERMSDQHSMLDVEFPSFIPAETGYKLVDSW